MSAAGSAVVVLVLVDIEPQQLTMRFLDHDSCHVRMEAYRGSLSLKHTTHLLVIVSP